MRNTNRFSGALVTFITNLLDNASYEEVSTAAVNKVMDRFVKWVENPGAMRERDVLKASVRKEASPVTLAQFNRFIRSAKTIGVGETVETDNLRIHRFRPSIKVTDLTNAGKRGKKVSWFTIYDTDHIQDDKVKKNLDKFFAGITQVKNYDQAAKWAKLIKKDADGRKGFGTLGFQEGTERGVDVRPSGPGHEPIKIDNKHMELEITPSDFNIRDKVDRNNLPACIPQPGRGQRSKLAKLYSWAKQNKAKLKNMTYQEAVNAIGEIADTHSYCRMD